jgi:bacteriocin-like protein
MNQEKKISEVKPDEEIKEAEELSDDALDEVSGGATINKYRDEKSNPNR